ncbi:MAG TPA: aldehyde dehydrogenase family protein [Ilumatobacteraceae bacterium]|nr:aldehyde dehydrogenase family protein [Ilumatobacteraceae bacterium]
MTVTVTNRIGGDTVAAADGATFERANPADRRQIVTVAPESSLADVTAAVDAASDAATAWRRTTPTRRAEILTAAARLLAERADDIAVEMVAEEGKPIGDAKMEASRTPRNLELYAGEAYRLTGATFPSDDTPIVYSVLDPIGVVGVITPWNFPLNLASRKIGPALAAGNTVVFKPSPLTPLMGERLAAAFIDAGLPDGVLNVVHGFQAGAHLVADERVGAITFTGSTATGRKIHAAVGLGRRVQLELGGKNPIIVLADADLDAAAAIVARSSFSLTGQACTGAGRILVADAIHDALVDKVVELAGKHVIGPGDRAGVTLGPLIDAHAVDAMRTTVATAERDGAELACGGTALDDDDLQFGCFYPPTVLTGVKSASELASREVFGPVIGFETFSDLDEAIASANAVEYGLSAAICTRDIAAAQRFAAEIEAGMVRVNRPTVGAAFNAPFGGIKQSGTGMHREQLGPTVMDFYTTTRTIWFGS